MPSNEQVGKGATHNADMIAGTKARIFRRHDPPIARDIDGGAGQTTLPPLVPAPPMPSFGRKC
jgi:hypothetical protein